MYMKNIKVAIFLLVFSILGTAFIANAADDIKLLVNSGKTAIGRGVFYAFNKATIHKRLIYSDLPPGRIFSAFSHPRPSS